MSDHTTSAAPFWRPSAHGARLILLWFAVAVAVIGAVALALSFVSVQDAARPYFGAAAWAIPVLMDCTIGVLTFFSITLELHRLRGALARYGARALVVLTVYANVAPQRGVYGKVLHGAPPVVWVLVVMVAEGAIRRLMGLSDEARIEALRRSLWLLRPVGTLRLWRMMRVHQITTYAEALDRDAARAAVVGRLRLHHGRLWRMKAPLAERIALRLQGRDPAGVAVVLRDHRDTAALLAGSVAEPGSGDEPDPAQAVPEPPAYRPRERSAPSRAARTRLPAPRRSEAELLAAAGALNAEAIDRTGTPVSLRRLKAELRVGQAVAERLRAAVVTAGPVRQRVPGAVSAAADIDGPAPLGRANGSAR